MKLVVRKAKLRHQPESREEAAVARPAPLGDEEEEEAVDEETPIWCTQCGSHYIRESTRRGPLDWLARIVSVRTFRCHSCYKRFYRFVAPGSTIRTWDPEPPHHKSGPG